MSKEVESASAKYQTDQPDFCGVDMVAHKAFIAGYNYAEGKLKAEHQKQLGIVSAYLDTPQYKLAERLAAAEQALQAERERAAFAATEALAAMKERDKYKAALEFYAAGKHWAIYPVHGERVLDKGEIAREALKESK